jgi:hypothetical protein
MERSGLVRTLRRVLVTLALLLAAPATAGAGVQPELKLLTPASGSFASIGVSSGYYDLTARELRIVTPRKPTGSSVAIPAGCTRRGVSPPDVLLYCGDKTGIVTYQLLDAGSGAMKDIDVSACGDRKKLSFGELGRYWIGGILETGVDTRGLPVVVPVFLNRSTGTCRRYSQNHGWRDLDRPGLPERHVPTCGDRSTKRLLKRRRRGLVLVFCHSHRRPARICNRCSEAALGRHGAAWLTASRVHTVLVRSGRRLSWRLPAAARRQADGTRSAAFVGDRLYLSLFVGSSASEERQYRIYTAQLWH